MTLVVLAALMAVPAGAATAQWLIIGALGFTIYGPQMLIGLCGAELVSPTAVSASQVGRARLMAATSRRLLGSCTWAVHGLLLGGACACQPAPATTVIPPPWPIFAVPCQHQ
jgi:hypothetical protein